jgi:hypothetical protein
MIKLNFHWNLFLINLKSNLLFVKMKKNFSAKKLTMKLKISYEDEEEKNNEPTVVPTVEGDS